MYFTPSTRASASVLLLLNFLPPPWCLRTRQHALLPLQATLLWTAISTASPLLTTLHKRKHLNVPPRNQGLTCLLAQDIYSMLTILLGMESFQHQPASFPHPLLHTYCSLCCFHEKQDKVLVPAAMTPAPSIPAQFLVYPLHQHSFTDPTTSTYPLCSPASGFHQVCSKLACSWTYPLCSLASGFHQVCSNLVLLIPTTFHTGDQPLPGFPIQINRNGHKGLP